MEDNNGKVKEQKPLFGHLWTKFANLMKEVVWLAEIECVCVSVRECAWVCVCVCASFLARDLLQRQKGVKQSFVWGPFWLVNLADKCFLCRDLFDWGHLQESDLQVWSTKANITCFLSVVQTEIQLFVKIYSRRCFLSLSLCQISSCRINNFYLGPTKMPNYTNVLLL